MAAHPQSWLHSTLEVWFGYFLTAICAIPASVLGLLLINKGVGRQLALIVSVSLAVLAGFVGERLVDWWSGKQRRIVILGQLDEPRKL